MIYINETLKRKKLIIGKDDDTITIKVKHIPIFMMMIQTHFGQFSEDCSFGKHEVVKKGNFLDTIVKKKGKSDASSKYAIGEYEGTTRLYGLDFDEYIEIAEDESKDVIVLLADYFIALSNERGYM